MRNALPLSLPAPGGCCRLLLAAAIAPRMAVEAGRCGWLWKDGGRRCAALPACATPHLLATTPLVWQVTYNAALTACERGGAWEEARLLLDDMSIEGHPPDVITYHAAIACTRDAGTAQAAELADGLVRRMIADGLRPSVIGLTGAMRACNVAAEWPRALGLYALLDETGVPADAVAIREGLVAAAGAADWQAALRLLDAREALGEAVGEGAGGERTSAGAPAARAGGGGRGRGRGRGRGGRGGRGRGRGGRRAPPARSSDYALGARACRAAGQLEHAERLESIAKKRLAQEEERRR